MFKKNYILILILISIVLLITYFNTKGPRYIGINYNVNKIYISNFQKIVELFERSKNYQKLSNEINKNSSTEISSVLNTSKWVYDNIKRITKNDTIVDNHTWTIIKRRLGTKDQFSDVLSVLLIYSDIDSFFDSNHGNKFEPFTFFKVKDKWSIIDPYNGIYFLNRKGTFSTLDEDKNTDWILNHLYIGEVNHDNFHLLSFEKKFHNFFELTQHYKGYLLSLPTSEQIEATHIFERGQGSRSYNQKPLYRLYYQFYRLYKKMLK